MERNVCSDKCALFDPFEPKKVIGVGRTSTVLLPWQLRARLIDRVRRWSPRTVIGDVSGRQGLCSGPGHLDTRPLIVGRCLHRGACGARVTLERIAHALGVEKRCEVTRNLQPATDNDGLIT